MNIAPPSATDLPGLLAWARRVTDDINRFYVPISNLPVFADDEAAATSRLKVGDPYVTPTGDVRRRAA